jgi:hypothetical protein
MALSYTFLGCTTGRRPSLRFSVGHHVREKFELPRTAWKGSCKSGLVSVIRGPLKLLSHVFEIAALSCSPEVLVKRTSLGQGSTSVISISRQPRSGVSFKLQHSERKMADSTPTTSTLLNSCSSNFTSSRCGLQKSRKKLPR